MAAETSASPLSCITFDLSVTLCSGLKLSSNLQRFPRKPRVSPRKKKIGPRDVKDLNPALYWARIDSKLALNRIWREEVYFMFGNTKRCMASQYSSNSPWELYVVSQYFVFPQQMYSHVGWSSSSWELIVKLMRVSKNMPVTAVIQSSSFFLFFMRFLYSKNLFVKCWMCKFVWLLFYKLLQKMNRDSHFPISKELHTISGVPLKHGSSDVKSPKGRNCRTYDSLEESYV